MESTIASIATAPGMGAVGDANQSGGCGGSDD